MSLFPLHKDELRDDQSDYEDEHHLRVHGLVAFVLGVHLCMLHPVEGREHSLKLRSFKLFDVNTEWPLDKFDN